MTQTISDRAYRELEAAVGPENISREPAVLDGYAFQTMGNFERMPWIPRPVAAVLPASTDEVQAIVLICREHGLKLKAFSTGWGAHAGPGVDGVVQCDLRRMDRILQIDEQNMFAVVEPYAIGAQIQAEAMRKGLNLHIIGAGSHTSPLASCTSMEGTGWTGISTGYSARNVLGVEWVLPTGEILRLGTPGSGLGWFSGDGPGPSLRGIMRGIQGAAGGLGIFTKCAIKLFPWNGPPQPKVRGTLFDVVAEIPASHRTCTCVFPSFDAYADAVYEIADAEIGFMLCKNSTPALIASLAPRLLRRIPALKSLVNLLGALRHNFTFMITGASMRETEYQELVLKEIIRRTRGILVDYRHIPTLHNALWWGYVRVTLPPLIFRMGGSFISAFGCCAAFDNAVNQARDSAALKRKYIDKGLMIDDLADNSWGGLYEGHYGHQEELIVLDPRNRDHIEGVKRYAEEASQIERKKGYGMGLEVTFEPEARDRIFGSLLFGFHRWQRRIKKAFDPDDVGDGTFYV